MRIESSVESAQKSGSGKRNRKRGRKRAGLIAAAKDLFAGRTLRVRATPSDLEVEDKSQRDRKASASDSQHAMAATADLPAAPILDPLSMAAMLRIPAMRRLWYAQIVSVFGDVLSTFAVIGVLTFGVQATAREIITVQIAFLLSMTITGVFAGVFVDRWPVKPTLVVSNVVRCGLILPLIVSTKSWHYYAVIASIGAVSSFFMSAQTAAIRAAVPSHGLRAANALMQQVGLVMRIVGSAFAGFLVANFGAKSCYLVDFASFAASALLIASLTLVLPVAEHNRVHIPDSPAGSANTSAARSILADMQAGFSFVLRHASLLFVVLALAAGMFVMGCFGPLIAIYIRDSVHASTRVFGYAETFIGIGIFAGISLLTTAAKRVSNEALVYAGLGGIVLGLAVITVVTAIWSTMLGALLIGFAVACIIIPAQTLVQEETPVALIGRVGSLVMAIVFSAQIAGLILSGLLAERIGIRSIFVVCALLLLTLLFSTMYWGNKLKPERLDV
jgi:MFS transporter, DHA3 family, macrolide efflux protein